MYKFNIITQVWVYLMIILAKQRAFMGKRDMIYDRRVGRSTFLWVKIFRSKRLVSDAGMCRDFSMANPWAGLL